MISFGIYDDQLYKLETKWFEQIQCGNRQINIILVHSIIVKLIGRWNSI